jgi:glycosyltransferase involved in cell wall biosynthesis
MPQISVIIPTHNRRSSLMQAVASALAQTLQDIEIIIVDDGSTDGTEDAVTAIASPKIRFFRFTQNRGGAAARNEGIRQASGEYIAFLDDDDTWTPDKLELQMETLVASGAELCWSALRHFRKNGKPGRRTFHPFPYPDQHKSIMSDNCIGGTSAVLVKRSRANAVGGFDEAFPALQDWEFYIRLIKSGCRAQPVDKPLVNYRKVDSVRVSGSFSRYKAATVLMKEKFGGDPYYPLLQRRLRIIEIKRMIKSSAFFFDAIRFYARKCVKPS